MHMHMPLPQVSFRQLLDVYFSRVDPTTLNRQGNDRGTQYRSGIFTHDEAQAAEARAKIAEVNEQLSQGVAGKWLGRKVVATVEVSLQRRERSHCKKNHARLVVTLMHAAPALLCSASCLLPALPPHPTSRVATTTWQRSTTSST
jgi:hypothetical protein